jgi:hypothetical protein
MKFVIIFFSLFFLLIIERNSSIQIFQYLLTNFIYKISCIFMTITMSTTMTLKKSVHLIWHLLMGDNFSPPCLLWVISHGKVPFMYFISESSNFISQDIRNSSIQIFQYLLTNFIYKISCIFCNIIIFWGRNRFLKFIQIEECISSIHMKNYTFVVLCSTLKKDEISQTNQEKKKWKKYDDKFHVPKDWKQKFPFFVMIFNVTANHPWR